MPSPSADTIIAGSTRRSTGCPHTRPTDAPQDLSRVMSPASDAAPGPASVPTTETATDSPGREWAGGGDLGTRGRGAGAGGRAPQQRRDRGAAVHLGTHRGEPRLVDAAQTRG